MIETNISVFSVVGISFLMLTVDPVSEEKRNNDTFGGFRKRFSSRRKNRRHGVSNDDTSTSMKVDRSSEICIVVLFDTIYNLRFFF